MDKCDTTDFPLLAWSAPACTVIAFPMVKRVGKIRRTADVLSGRRGKSADQYWRQIASGLRSQMEASQIPDAVIDDEIRAFFYAVRAEMALANWRHRPDGAA